MKSTLPKTSPGIEEIRLPHSGPMLALIIRHHFQGQKYNFPTPKESALQLGINFYSAGEVIQAHEHLPRRREFQMTQEFITVSEGAVILFLYDAEHHLVAERTLEKGDSVLLLEGGHGFKVMQDTKLTEVKLGPYDEIRDKTRFSA